MKIPYIKSEYRPLFKPEKYGSYVNDHCFIKKGNEYHLFGITSFSPSAYNEKYFVHATGTSLLEPFREVRKVIDKGTLAWSPCITEKDGCFYMVYGPSPTSLAVSPDLHEWFGYAPVIKSEPPMAVHRDHFVLQSDDGKYLMYVSGIKDKKGCISLCSSDDLINWEFEGFALTSGDDAPLTPPWGAMESPFVVKKDGLYYLFVTYTDSHDENYNDTLVFVSEDPKDFGCYKGKENEAVPITVLHAHAPEIITENGKTYITTCGWLNRPNVHPGCVSIAELGWQEQK